MTSTRTLTWIFPAAGVAVLGLAAVVTLRAVPAPVVGPAAQRVQIDTVDVQSDLPLVGGAIPPGGRTNAAMTPGTGLIFGQTLEAGSSRPLAGALVTLRVPGVAPLSVISDGEGRFVFRDLPKGSFTLDAAKNGYLGGSFGRMRPSGASQTIVLAEGERLSNVKVSLWKYGAITGRVLDESGEPMIGTMVRVLRKTIVSGKPRLTLGAIDQTDDRGVYRISTLEPGEYLVCVPAPMSQSGTLAAVARDLEAMRAQVEASAIGGGGSSFTFATLADQASGAAVGAAAFSLADASGSVAGPGTDGRPQSYPTAYYPSTSSASHATIVAIGSGDERTGIDFQLRPVTTQRVSGAVLGPAGPAANLSVTLLPIDADDFISPLDTATSRTDAAGAFTFTSVAPGNYTLRVVRAQSTTANLRMAFSTSSNGTQVTLEQRVIAPASGPLPPLSTDPTLWAELPVSVSTTDLTGIALAMRTGLKVTGQVEWSGAATRPPPDKLPNVGVTLEPADARTSAVTGALPGRVDTTGGLTTVGAPPGRYFVRVSGAPPGWFFRGATAGGRDATDVPLEIDAADITGVTLTFTDRQTALSGTVTDISGAIDSTAAVIVFPAERGAWSGAGASVRRLRNVRAGVKGEYSIQGLPAGRYYIAAVRDAIAGEWQDAKFLETLSTAATTIDLAEGQTSTQQLKVVR